MKVELITPDEMRRVEALAPAHGVSLEALMENAARSVAAEIISRFPQRPITILCGPGNNGGDGFGVARLLDDLGWPVSVHFLGDFDALQGDALTMARKWTKAIRTIDQPFEGAVIVDALFGIGLNRDFPADLAKRIAAAKVPVVSVDVPSGVDGLTGQVRNAAVKADVTVTFFRQKPAHVLRPGKDYCGEIVVTEIGLPHQAEAAAQHLLWINEKPKLPKHSFDTHKYRRGGVVVWSGDALHTGASRLSALAAQRAGAGIVCLAGPRDGLMVQAHHVTSIVLHEASTSGELSTLLESKKYAALCIGPAGGVTEALRRLVMAGIAAGKPVVFDADAFSVFEGHREILLRLTKQNKHVVMTPHDGEFERLFPEIAAKSESRIDRARAAAALAHAIVVLKGPGTVIAHPDGRAAVQVGAPAKLATAGSGDVLAGLIAGLLAQGFDAFAAARAGVFLHSEAANSWPRDVMTAEDLLGMISD
jgi:ADP-dependent NAD(P)H-hydrate dehydratase / NAD(P)H-hydrate epimerase